MFGVAGDKKICLESRTITSNAGMSVRPKAILEAALHKKAMLGGTSDKKLCLGSRETKSYD